MKNRNKQKNKEKAKMARRPYVGAAALRQRSGAWGSARCGASGPHGVWHVGAGQSR